MIKTKTFLVIVVIAVIVILIAWVIILGVGKKEEKSKPEAPAIAEKIYNLSGEIKEIKGKTLVLESRVSLANLLEEPITMTVKVIINDNTKFFKLKFPKDIPEGSTEPITPEETKIRFDDLKVGNKIDVETIGNISENIKNKIKIPAKTINVIE